MDVQLGHQVARFFGTIATLGTPLDITLQELRIESFHPADEGSRGLVRALLGGHTGSKTASAAAAADSTT